ncbi:MAG: SsrA-binding protein SmpB [Bdellovibrionales bacterium]|nr:SsrA-binding protein SmpB [Bdellovibrionales bacterium]
MSKVKPGAKDTFNYKVVVENRKARFNYHILDTFEAGLVLQGWEVKSIRAGQANLSEGYIGPNHGELWLLGAHISPYKFTRQTELNPLRPRKLLLHKKEIDKLSGRVREKGLTIVPLKLYLKNGLIKIEIGLAKGKLAPDKRDTIKERDAKRELERAFRGK